MGTEERGEIIAGKCAMARQKDGKTGCPPKDAARHYSLFVHEHWDVHHPPDEFRQWWSKHPEAEACRPVTAWNTDRNRQEFNRWRKGEPEPEGQPS